MSIKGIDTQIMIARTAEYVKDSSLMQKKHDLTHDYLAVQAKAEEKHEQQTVNKAQESEMVRLHLDDHGSSGGRERKAGSEKNDEEEDGEPRPGSMVLPEDHIIDIKI